MNTKPLAKGPPAKHISAGRCHSVVATASAVYTFGLNAGQLGHLQGDRHITVHIVLAELLGGLLGVQYSRKSANYLYISFSHV